MKIIIILSTLLMVFSLPVVSACQTDSGEPRTYIPLKVLQSPTGIEAPDDIVFTPGGYAYRANVHGAGEEDPWPSIQSANVTLDSGSDILNIIYREYIETKAGETRNNIVFIWKEGGLFNSELEFYSVAVPDEIVLTNSGGGGRPGILLKVLVIEILPGAVPGQYTFQIGIEVDGKDYGTIPCTVSVTE